MELIQRTGKIFTAGSYYHGNTSVSWVEHELMKAPDFLNNCGTLLAHVVDVLVMLVTSLSHVVVVLVIVITLLAPVVEVLIILAQLSKSQPNRPPLVRG